jgi:3-oxoacyl-[acyl-carrier protein] reductase
MLELPFGKFLDLEPTDWERIIQVNNELTIRLVQFTCYDSTTSGDIINISSTAGLAGNALTSATAHQNLRSRVNRLANAEMRKHNVELLH